jgi:hypothetical protein
MAYEHIEKNKGDLIKSNEWNNIGQELERLEKDKVHKNNVSELETKVTQIKQNIDNDLTIKLNTTEKKIETTEKKIKAYVDVAVKDLKLRLYMPGNIRGMTPVTKGVEREVTYSIAEVPQADSYKWRVTGGASITTGQGSKSINIRTPKNDEYSIHVCSVKDNINSKESDLTVTRVKAMGIQFFKYSGKIETWTVPIGVQYVKIEAWGAQGGGTKSNIKSGGKGAYISGNFIVSAGHVFNILVGEQGKDGSFGEGGGGGGSFIVNSSTNELLIVAGGGGGAGSRDNGGDGLSGINGGNGTRCGTTATGQGGKDGKGGSCAKDDGGGGGGYLSNGTTNPVAKGGKSYKNGGAGGTTRDGTGVGGFGGGSGADEENAKTSAGGGGGGYSGGGGGGGENCDAGGGGAGGGGGSYVAGSADNIEKKSGIRTGHGELIITY